MVIDETEQYVLDWFKYYDPPFNDEDAFIFLAHHGVFLNVGAEFNSVDLSSYDNIQLSCNMANQPAYIVVESKTKGIDHAVFWDTKNVLDPLYCEPQKLSKYKVKVYYPIMMTKRRLNRCKNITENK